MTAMPALNALRILLVEDSKTDALLIKKALAQALPADHTLLRVEHIASALQALGEATFDVILLDLTLPDANAFGGLLSLQTTAPAIPIIMLTAHADEALAFKALEHGAQDYLFKDRMSGPLIAQAVRYAVQRKQFENALITQANFDPLTGLVNRALFESRLDMAIARSKRSGSGFAVLFLDLNRFKYVNDTLGHAAGDRLLEQVAKRLQQSVRPYDTVARFGGDEFALLIEAIDHPRDCATVAQKIIDIISAPFHIHKRNADIGVSIGIVLCAAQDNSTCDVLMRQADQTMYRAKTNPHSNYQFYSAEIQQETQARLQLETELRTALKKAELELYYQPKLDVRSGNVVGAEALLRWNHPTRGVLLPDIFIHAAETLGLMTEIGHWILLQACSDLQKWKRAQVATMQLSVNISAMQLDDLSFPILVERMLTQYDFAHRLLVLEIPSAALLHRTHARMQALAALEILGVALHLDHFGANAVSLAAVQSMPLQALKIDSQVVRGLSSDSQTLPLIQAIIAIAHKFNLEVVASGVENQWQRNFLQEQQCDHLQGFFLGHPMPADNFTAWLKDKKFNQ